MKGLVCYIDIRKIIVVPALQSLGILGCLVREILYLPRLSIEGTYEYGNFFSTLLPCVLISHKVKVFLSRPDEDIQIIELPINKASLFTYSLQCMLLF